MVEEDLALYLRLRDAWPACNNLDKKNKLEVIFQVRAI